VVSVTDPYGRILGFLDQRVSILVFLLEKQCVLCEAGNEFLNIFI
jgi:hypothetical protein